MRLVLLPRELGIELLISAKSESDTPFLHSGWPSPIQEARDLPEITSCKPHQAGVNALDAYVDSKRDVFSPAVAAESDACIRPLATLNTIRVATAGDDNAVKLTTLAWNAAEPHKSISQTDCTLESAHASTIQGRLGCSQ